MHNENITSFKCLASIGSRSVTPLVYYWSVVRPCQNLIPSQFSYLARFFKHFLANKIEHRIDKKMVKHNEGKNIGFFVFHFTAKDLSE